MAVSFLLANCGPKSGKANAPITSPSQEEVPDTSIQERTAPVGPAAEAPIGDAASPSNIELASSSLPAPEPIDEALDCLKTDIFSAGHSRQKVFDTRYGADVQRISQVPTTHKRPLETCGLAATLSALLHMQCNSGKPAFQSKNAAHDSRRGGVGPGGRCGSILDLYDVSCPEANYEIHVDMYFCGPKGTAKDS